MSNNNQRKTASLVVMLNGNKVIVTVLCADDGTEQRARARPAEEQGQAYFSFLHLLNSAIRRKRDFQGNLETLYDLPHLRFQHEGGKHAYFVAVC